MIFQESMVSVNCEYLAIRQDMFIMLFWSNKLLWQDERNSTKFKLCGIGNNGSLIVIDNHDLFIFQQDGKCEKIRLGCISQDGIKAYSVMNALLDEQGRTACVEILTEREGRDRFFFRKASSKENIITEHKLILIDLEDRSEREIWSFEKDAEKELSFHWDITGDFRNITIAETSMQEKPLKSIVTRIYILDIIEDKSILQINLADPNILGIKINKNGQILLQIKEETRHQFVIIEKNGEKSFIDTPARDIRLLHYGSDVIVFSILPERILLFKDFSGQVVYLLDDGIIEALGINFPIVFRSNDECILLSYDEEKIKIKRYDFSWKARRFNFISHR